MTHEQIAQLIEDASEEKLRELSEMFDSYRAACDCRKVALMRARQKRTDEVAAWNEKAAAKLTEAQSCDIC